MDDLTFNAVLRISGSALHGLYRVVAVPPGNTVAWLARIGPFDASSGGEAGVPPPSRRISLSRAAISDLDDLAAAGDLLTVEVRHSGKLLLQPDDLKPAERVLWEKRTLQMASVFDHQSICEALTRSDRIAPLIHKAVAAGKGSRATAYRLWLLFCEFGFEATSLYPRFERRGAPGVRRPAEGGKKKTGRKTRNQVLGQLEPHPQRGVTSDDRVKMLHHARALMKPGVSLRRLYAKVIERVYVRTYQEGVNGRVPVVPEQGTYPNLRQFRYIVETGVTALERVRAKTTQGHFDRNYRGLRGRAFDGVAGPGHAYAIDSTLGDIYLRSAINRAWPVGRPVVYVVVDVWSTAIVGFYACLSGPSWSTAQLAIFAASADPKLLAELWGYEYIDVLSPAPTVPFHFWTDRGEYNSEGARETASILGTNLAINAAYRPDLKGLVEVLHRIAKDQQYAFLPGAIDARRREIDLNPTARDSALTLREYVHYLHGVCADYNLWADRSHRMTAEMIGAGIEPTPAGLWRFGHEVGIGYRKAIGQDRLITTLLPRRSAIARRDGVFLESLQYEAEIAQAQQWTALARNFDFQKKLAYHFPGTVSRFWWPDPNGSLHEFSLRANARAPGHVTQDEWRDALAVEHGRLADKHHRRIEAAIKSLSKQEQLRRDALERTAGAVEIYVGPIPNSREARALDVLASTAPTVDPIQESAGTFVPEGNAGYDSLMDEIFDSMNREGGH